MPDILCVVGKKWRPWGRRLVLAGLDIIQSCWAKHPDASRPAPEMHFECHKKSAREEKEVDGRGNKMKVNVQISDLCVFCDEEKRAAEEKRLRGRCTRHKPEGRADATCTINYLNKKKEKALCIAFTSYGLLEAIFLSSCTKLLVLPYKRYCWIPFFTKSIFTLKCYVIYQPCF